MGVIELIAVIIGAGGAGSVLTVVTTYFINKRKADADIDKDARGQLYTEYKDLVKQLQAIILELRSCVIQYQNDYEQCLSENAALKQKVEFLEQEISRLKESNK